MGADPTKARVVLLNHEFIDTSISSNWGAFKRRAASRQGVGQIQNDKHYPKISYLIQLGGKVFANLFVFLYVGILHLASTAGAQKVVSLFSNARRSKASTINWITVTSRVGAAAIGGYALTYACTAWLSIVLPLGKSEAVLTASMISFVIYTAAILWAFAATTPMGAWLVLLIATGLLGGMTFLMT